MAVNKIRLGSIKPTKFYLGEKEISKICLSDVVIYKSAGTIEDFVMSLDNDVDNIALYTIQNSWRGQVQFTKVTDFTNTVTYNDVKNYIGQGDYTLGINKQQKSTLTVTIDGLYPFSILSFSGSAPHYTQGLDFNFTSDNLVNVTNMNGMFFYCSGLTSLDLSNFDTSNVTNMSYMFYNCSDLTSLDVTNFDTSNVTNMSYMFYNCSDLTSLDVTNFDTSNVTNMSYMFSDCSDLTSLDVSNFDTSKVTNMSYMFSSCNALTSLDVSNFDTSKVTSMDGMFYYCNALTSLDLSNFDTINVTSMDGMFDHCSGLTSLDVSNFDTSNVTSMDNMFRYCSNLTSLDVTNFDTNNLTRMGYTFSICSGLTSLDLSSWNTSKVYYITGLFDCCTELTNLDISNWDVSQVDNYQYANIVFRNCTKLTTLIGTHTLEEVEAGTITTLKGLKVSLGLSSTALDRASLLAVIKGLATVTSTTTLTLGSTLLAKLTDEDKKIATDKGWTLA